MSKDQKSMGWRNVIHMALCATPPPLLPLHHECLLTSTEVAFVRPLGDVTQARGSRPTIFGYRPEIAFYLKVTGLLSYTFVSDGRQKSWAAVMCRLVLHHLTKLSCGGAGKDQWAAWWVQKKKSFFLQFSKMCIYIGNYFFPQQID